MGTNRVSPGCPKLGLVQAFVKMEELKPLHMGVYGSVWMSGIELWTWNDKKCFWKQEKANENVYEMSPYDSYVNES